MLSWNVRPSVVQLAASPRAPPSDQRSCWKTVTTRLGFLGSTDTFGSTSVAG